MVDIHINDIPEGTFETIRRRARAAGKSTECYLRDLLIEVARKRTKEEAWAEVESELAGADSAGPALGDIVQYIADYRR